jgi:hypothetical protein
MLGALPIRQLPNSGSLPKLIGIPKTIIEILDYKVISKMQNHKKIRKASRAYYIYCRIFGKATLEDPKKHQNKYTKDKLNN